MAVHPPNTLSVGVIPGGLLNEAGGAE